jgi:hypothetical protein
MSTSGRLEDSVQANGDERQDEDREHQISERAVAVGDEGDEPEAAGEEQSDDEQDEGDV